MTGQWPPDWENMDWGEPDAEVAPVAGVPAPDADPRLSEVAAALAAVPAAEIPAAFESRISAAIAAESARRAAGDGAADQAATVRSRRIDLASRRTHPRRQRRVRPRTVAVSAAACLVLALIGLFVVQSMKSASPTYSSTEGSVAAPAASSAPSAGAAAGPENQPAAEAPSRASGASAGFVVTASGTRYERATLATQVRDVMAGAGTSTEINPAASAAASGPATSFGRIASGEAGTAPSAALEGCVRHLTGNVTPGLVDRARYQGKPAYVIATASRAWVVGLGCTAANPELVTTVPLTG